MRLSHPAPATPDRMAAPLPQLCGRRTTVEWANEASRRSATSAVSSVLPSSTTMISVWPGPSSPRSMEAMRTSRPVSIRSRSLYAGRTSDSEMLDSEMATRRSTSPSSTSSRRDPLRAPILEQSPSPFSFAKLHRFAALSSPKLSAVNFHCQQRISPPSAPRPFLLPIPSCA